MANISLRLGCQRALFLRDTQHTYTILRIFLYMISISSRKKIAQNNYCKLKKEITFLTTIYNCSHQVFLLGLKFPLECPPFFSQCNTFQSLKICISFIFMLCALAFLARFRQVIFSCSNSRIQNLIITVFFLLLAHSFFASNCSPNPLFILPFV
jgi:hypothetical protein